VRRDVWLRKDFCTIEKRVQNRKGRKKKMPRVVKKGVEKKSLLNAGESGEAVVKLPYSRIWENIQINGENGCLMSKKQGYSVH